jgi:hypothetical protein
MRHMIALLLAVALLPSAARAESDRSDPKAVAIADRVIRELGGADRWSALPALRWSFDVSVNDTVRASRRHAWDKRTGWYRVEGMNRQGQKFVFTNKLGTDEGHAWVDGQPIEGDSLKKLMKRTHSLWTNDLYWLAMSLKLRDPGVILTYDGEVKDSLPPDPHDKVGLAFDHVGETPGDRYWVYVNRRTHRIDRWDHLLQGEQPPPTVWTLEGWEQHGGLWFATAHRQAGNRVVYTRNIETPAAIPEAEFQSP